LHARWIAGTAGLDVSAVLAGRTSVSELVAAGARVVCGDTGVAAPGQALGTLSVVLFGPTSAAR
jgi:ADP-heptose:LPS heptosyltransferase